MEGTMAVLSCCTGIDVNFMDDVGQTLLNWASAFGTYEMVLAASIVVLISHTHRWSIY